MIKKVAGIKREVSERSKESYTLYDRADICPLWAYIEATARENLPALTITGNPPVEALESVRTNLIIELSELSGNSHAQAMKSSLRKIYHYRAVISGARISLIMLLYGENDEASLWFRKRNIQAKDIPSLIRKGIAYIKSQETRLKGEMKRYESLISSSGNGNTITESYYTDMLITLSKHVGFRLDKNIMLAEFAAYIKDIKQTIERSKRHGRK